MVKPATSSSSFGASSLFHFLLFALFFTGGRGEVEKCEKNEIVITQGDAAPQFNGIPTYVVEITNHCRTDCTISGLHVSCGSFSSAKAISPLVFKRLAVNDCLVNNGAPIPSGTTISFKYATTFKFPLSVTSFQCS